MIELEREYVLSTPDMRVWIPFSVARCRAKSARVSYACLSYVATVEVSMEVYMPQVGNGRGKGQDSREHVVCHSV